MATYVKMDLKNKQTKQYRTYIVELPENRDRLVGDYKIAEKIMFDKMQLNSEDEEIVRCDYIFSNGIILVK